MKADQWNSLYLFRIWSSCSLSIADFFKLQNIIRTNIFDCFIQKLCIKMDYKDVSWKMDYCCLNAHLSESSKELVVSFDIYIRLICITTITLSMSLFFSFLALLSYPFLFTEFFKTSALSPCQQKYLGEVFRT